MSSFRIAHQDDRARIVCDFIFLGIFCLYTLVVYPSDEFDISFSVLYKKTSNNISPTFDKVC